MITLYIDNFRGFSNTYIPISDVNFLVGENSTGKTSILSLIRLLETPYFWFEQEFNPEDIQLGSFKDIVSANAQNKSYFKIGVIGIGKDKKGRDKNPYAFLMKFISHEGLPAISQYSYLQEKEIVTTRIVGSKLFYKIKRLSNKANTSNGIMNIFKMWVKENYKEKEFKELTNFPPFHKKGSNVFNSATIQFAIAGLSKDSKKEMGIRVPGFGSMSSAWIAPIRSKPRRTYDQYKINFSPEGDHIPYLIKKLLTDKRKGSRFRKFLTIFGINSGLFSKLSINRFGDSPESPFELDVSIGKIPINIQNVGYGVSQSLPIIVEIFARAKNEMYMIQQPEVHLHPRAQASLGDVIYHSAQNENKKFIVETHSDFTIDRYRINLRKATNLKHKSQVIFFERIKTGNKATILELSSRGDYPDNQPQSFRSFFLREEMNILGLK